MSPRRPQRVRAAQVPPDITTTLVGADFTRAYGFPLTGTPDRTAEDWAHACFDDAPAAIRVPVVLGWRAVLRLRLGPSPSPGHVLGWTIRSRTRDVVVLDVSSPLLQAQKLVRVESGRLTVTTVVRATHRAGRVMWSLVRPVHQLLEPVLLTLAARRASRATG